MHCKLIRSYGGPTGTSAHEFANSMQLAAFPHAHRHVYICCMQYRLLPARVCATAIYLVNVCTSCRRQDTCLTTSPCRLQYYGITALGLAAGCSSLHALLCFPSSAVNFYYAFYSCFFVICKSCIFFPLSLSFWFRASSSSC
jgi:hypothetical protein